MFLLEDTIAALASAAGSAGRGIIRVSGPDVIQLLDGLFYPQDAAAWTQATFASRHPGHWQIGKHGRLLPVDVYLWPTGRSYTGQRQVELHTIASPPLLEVVLSDLFAAGARPAQAGEFTLRAFLAGRVDLMQAEAVLGVIDAANQCELQTALTQLAGGISQRLTLLRAEFLDLLADLEAGLDFTEEGLEFVSRDVVLGRIVLARAELQRLLAGTIDRSRHSVRRRVVLAGPPNAGKSTLFNTLVGREAALVSPIAGTTRDYLTAELEWHGVPIELVDTAGWEETTSELLKVALQLRKGQMDQADLILDCVAADAIESPSQPTHDPGPSVRGGWNRRSVRVITKSDTLPGNWSRAGIETVQVSAINGDGIEILKQEVARKLGTESAGEADLLGSTASRCRDSITNAIAALSRAAVLAEQGGGEEFLATDVREALEEIGRITGAVYTDDLLDRIFSKFCIGK